jgi:hypothetical protein
MNCYEFEKNISASIDGELKKLQKEHFNKHIEECQKCSGKVIEISSMLNNFKLLNEIRTSSNFEASLKGKIREFENKKPGLWHKILNFKPLGFEPIPALGLSLALVMIIGSSYMLLNQDVLPEVKFKKITNNKIPSNFKPSIVSPIKQVPSIAEEDSSIQLKDKKRNNKIRLVGGK